MVRSNRSTGERELSESLYYISRPAPGAAGLRQEQRLLHSPRVGERRPTTDCLAYVRDPKPYRDKSICRGHGRDLQPPLLGRWTSDAEGCIATFAIRVLARRLSI